MTRRRPGSRPEAARAEFWGAESEPEPERPEPRRRIRLSTDPAALPRSLGPPPLTMSPSMAMGSLAATYEEAVRAAAALAASCGLLGDDEPA